LAMEASTLARNIDLISTVGGATLNLEHRASLPAALAILQSENNFARVTLWGRISGDKQDYIIAQGWTPTPDEKTERSKIAGGNALIAEYFELMKQIPKSSFRLSPDGVTFVPIPPVDDEIVRQNEELTKALNAKGQVFAPFTGDPAAKTQYEFVIPAPPKEPKGPSGNQFPLMRPQRLPQKGQRKEQRVRRQQRVGRAVGRAKRTRKNPKRL